MANRILRDWTQSEKINILTVHAERFFTRLIMKVDDYGCYSSNVKLIKSTLFPLLIDEVREADISRWMTECQKAGLILFYEINEKQFIRIQDFRQRLRVKQSKYPLPDDGHMTADGGHLADNGRLETKRNETKRNELAFASSSDPGGIQPYSLEDYYPNGKEAFEDIRNDEKMVEKMLQIVHMGGYAGCNEVTLMKAVRYFIGVEEAKPDFILRPKKEVKKHAVNWVSKFSKTLNQYG